MIRDRLMKETEKNVALQVEEMNQQIDTWFLDVVTCI